MLPKELKFTLTINWRTVGMAALLSPVGVLIVWWVWSWPWGDSNTPAWVQAIGSIAAILVSVWIANAKDRREEHRERERESVLLEVVVGAIRGVQAEAVGLCEATGITGRPRRLDNASAALGRIAAMLDGLNLVEMPTPKIAQEIIYIRGITRHLHVHMVKLGLDPLDLGAKDTVQTNAKLLSESAAKLMNRLEATKA